MIIVTFEVVAFVHGSLQYLHLIPPDTQSYTQQHRANIKPQYMIKLNDKYKLTKRQTVTLTLAHKQNHVPGILWFEVVLAPATVVQVHKHVAVQLRVELIGKNHTQ